MTSWKENIQEDLNKGFKNYKDEDLFYRKHGITPSYAYWLLRYHNK